MFNSKYENRLAEWRQLRDSIEESEDPLRLCLEFWDNIPEVRLAADPYDQSNWPTPWEMIEENNFCSFVKILAICYTLQLTERFSHETFEINIVQDRNKQDVSYLLFFDTTCIGYEPMKAIPIENLPKNLIFEMRCPMPNLQ
jgi:hypothetical protein